MIQNPEAAPTLVSAIRQRPFLATGDSVYRAVDMLRETGADTLPVVNAYGQLKGVVTLTDLRYVLAQITIQGAETDAVLLEPIVQWMRKPGDVGHANMSLKEAQAALTDSGETTLFILDAEERYLGAVTLADFLVPSQTPPRPPSIGGMATPWGVYLTDGTLQAGVGNAALIGSGALMGLLLICSWGAVGLLSWLFQQATGWGAYRLWSSEIAPHNTNMLLAWMFVHGISIPLFLVLMRAFPLAGYHAAEHQAVHAMERGEPLMPQIVKRMPRVHPRCGTNLMAGGIIFAGVAKILPALHLGIGSSDSAVLGAIVALFTWRSVGTFLQQYFTTRPANDRQIASGIAAAQDLERKYLHTVLRRPNLLRRLWCMGMPQMMIGTSISATAVVYILDFLFKNLK